jgi:hypothetical protein
VEPISITVECAALTILALILLPVARTTTEKTFVALWALLALVDLTLVLWPEQQTWANYAPYWVFISMMLFIGFERRNFFKKS